MKKIFWLTTLTLLVSSTSGFAKFLELPMLRTHVGEERADSKMYANDDLTPVKYIETTEERNFYKITFKNGLLYDSNNKLLDTTGFGNEFDYAIYVMDLEGNFYVSTRFNDSTDAKQKQLRFHHSTFVAGGAIAGAGKLIVINGVLRKISNDSGHYEPSKYHLQQTVDELRKYLKYDFEVSRTDPEYLNYICGSVVSD